jgi:hypothetical protein
MPIQTKPKDVRFEVFTAVTMKNAVFWDVTPCGSYKNPKESMNQRSLEDKIFCGRIRKQF